MSAIGHAMAWATTLPVVRAVMGFSECLEWCAVARRRRRSRHAAVLPVVSAFDAGRAVVDIPGGLGFPPALRGGLGPGFGGGGGRGGVGGGEHGLGGAALAVPSVAFDGHGRPQGGHHASPSPAGAGAAARFWMSSRARSSPWMYLA